MKTMWPLRGCSSQFEKPKRRADGETPGLTCSTFWGALAVSGPIQAFLAWLLDPTEAHGLRDSFLRQFMAKAIGTEPRSPMDVTVSAELQCGGMRFDIHVKGDRWCLIVETKIDDFSWQDQSSEYAGYCQKLGNRGEQAWLVYITRPARRPSNSIRWISYSEIRQILERLTPDPSAVTLIEHFCQHIVSDLEA
jgi:hypothetical protein